MISIVRHYFSYEIATISTYKVTLNIVMKVTDQDYFFLPIQGYKADLNIIDSEGNDMIILSDSEAERLGFKMTELNRKYAERMKTKLSTETQKLSENFRIIVVLFN